MAGLFLHRSNRLETLADELARILREPLANVFAADVVVVQSLGMRRWLSLELAGRLGVTMNCEFPFPAGFAHRLFRAIAPGLKPDSAFDREVLPWRILSALEDLLDKPGSEPLRRYVNGEMDEVKLYQLAMQLGEVFDRYLVFRAETLLQWQDDRKSGDWQAKLWRELTKGRAEEHPPALLRRLLAHTSAGGALPGIPERLCVFGVSNLPPFHLQVLNAAARSMDVHLFLFEPTEHYWGDVQSPREQERFLRKHASETQTAEDFHLDAGNPLLASLGRPGRAFSQALLELEAHGENAAFAEPQGDSVLSRLQRDIFELRDGTAERSEEPVEADDLSLQVHCCHGPMREVEVLHDQLLNLFEKLPGLSPKDILVTMPDIETYAPFIEAVFGAPEDERVRIPFTIADRQVAADDTVSTAFLQLLDLQKSLFTASEVISILEAAPIRRRFGLEENELSTIRRWVVENAIRWGIDAGHRVTFGLPAEAQNTWRAGLDRLLLGYAMSGSDDAMFGGILPAPDIEGDLADLLGNFAQFCDQLFTRLLELGRARSLRNWETAFRDVLDAFFDDREESADSVRRLRTAFEQMGNMEAHHPDEVSFDVALAHLKTVIEQGNQGFGFLAGRATFCSLKPMRSVPFRVICLLGMSDTAFPRQDTGLSFDLMTGEPRPGDRSRRDDDRQLFLESLLSARDCLYLSYPGRSQRDHSETPPSVVVAELLDYVEAAYGGSLRAQIVTKHRLQPFSPEYFREGSRLFSYSAENSRANDQRGRAATDPAPFVTAPLAAPETDFLRVDLHQLTNFLCHPARHFLRERLGIRLPDTHDLLEESEPMGLDALTSTRLRDDALQQLLKGAASEDTLRLARARGELPHGWSGDYLHGEVQQGAAGLMKQLQPLVQSGPLEPPSLELAIGRWTLTGTVRSVYPAGAVRFRASSIKSKDYLRAWVQHLALNASAPPGVPRNTVLLGTDEAQVEFPPLSSAHALLEDLLELYGEGFTEPVPFLPKASWAYMETLKRGKTPADAMQSARNAWFGSKYSDGPAEESDPWNQVCFRNREPLDDRWLTTTERVLQPLLAAIDGTAGEPEGGE